MILLFYFILNCTSLAVVGAIKTKEIKMITFILGLICGFTLATIVSVGGRND